MAFLPTEAVAQYEHPPVSAEERAKILEMLPDEFIDEATEAYDKCNADNVQSKYYNCECLSSTLLEERIKAGPDPTASALMMNLSLKNQCRDATGAAGDVYNKCLSMHGRMKPGTDPEKYCECVANEYAKAFDTLAPPINSTNMVNIQSMAMAGCAKPNEPSPIELILRNRDQQ